MAALRHGGTKKLLFEPEVLNFHLLCSQKNTTFFAIFARQDSGKALTYLFYVESKGSQSKGHTNTHLDAGWPFRQSKYILKKERT